MDVDVRVGRIYDEPSPGDGMRVLVDRIWPRGLTKSRACLDEWCKAVAPSTALRRWYRHDPAKFDEFRRSYQLELEEPDAASALRRLRHMADGQPITLLTATKRVELSDAAVLAELLRDR